MYFSSGTSSSLMPDKGHPKSMSYYALMLYNGKEICMNRRESACDFKMAADRGGMSSMYCYEEMRSKGDCVPKKMPESAKYYTMSADLSDSESMYRYGICLIEGPECFVEDTKEAKMYFKMSAKLGNKQGICASKKFNTLLNRSYV